MLVLGVGIEGNRGEVGHLELVEGDGPRESVTEMPIGIRQKLLVGT